MPELENLQTFFASLLRRMDSTDQSTKVLSQFSQKIQAILQSNLENITEEDLLNINISTLKQQFEEVGIGHLLEESAFQEIDQLLSDLRNQRFADLGSSLDALAANFDAVGPQPDVDLLIAGLEKHFPTHNFGYLAPKLKNTNPDKLLQTIQKVAQRLKDKPENLDLDSIVQIFEQNLGGLFEAKRKQQEEQKMQEYRGSARQSILKSLQAKGFPPPNEE